MSCLIESTISDLSLWFYCVLSAQTHQKPEITPPNFSTVQVTDIFQRLVRPALPVGTFTAIP